MLSRLLTAFAIGAATVFLAPPPHVLAHPNSIGKVCGFVSIADPADPGVQTGSVHAGPWVAVAAQSVDITCVIRVNGVPATMARSSNSGSVGLLAAPINYPAQPDDDISVCTYVHWRDLSGNEHGWTGKEDADGDYFCDW